MKLIDPSKLDGCKLCTTDQFPRDRRVEGWNDCIEYLQKCCTHVPVVDAVEVVRCADCVHGRVCKFDVEEPEIMICIHKNMFPMRTSPGLYCAHGVKKDVEVEG